jgi:hypothetical protein
MLVARPARPCARRTVRVPLASLAALALIAAACSKPKPVQLGPDPSLAPRLSVADSVRPPRAMTVELAEPASVVVLAVFPGRGATIVWPQDSAASPQLGRGTHQLPIDSVRLPASPDTVLFRRPSGVGVDTARARRDRDRQMRIDTAGIRRGMVGPEGAHFLLFASRAPISYAAVRRRVEGVTIPIGTNEALNTVSKILADAVPGDSRWAGYATEVRLR